MMLLDYHETDDFTNESFKARVFVRHTNSTSIGCRLHWHEALEIFHVRKGHLTVTISGTIYELHEGDTAVVNPHELHRSIEFGDHTTHVNLKIHRDFIDSRSPDLCHKAYIHPLFFNNVMFRHKISDRKLGECIESIVHATNSASPGWELHFKSEVFKIISVLFNGHIQIEPGPKQSFKNILSIRNLINYININYANQLTLSALSNMAGYSDAHLCRLFSSIVGCSPITYLNTVRCENAYRLLKETDLSITEIATASGFNDANYFTRTFKKLLGQTPSQVRKE